MATDIYGRNTGEFGGVYNGEKVGITLSSNGGNNQLAEAGFLTQQLGMAYQQQITRIYELNSSKHYYVIGRTAGSCNIQKMVGSQSISDAFYTTFGDGCNAPTNNLEMNLSSYMCADSNGRVNQQNDGGAYEAKFCVIDQFQIQGSVQQLIVGETVNLMIGSLFRKNGNAARAAAAA